MWILTKNICAIQRRNCDSTSNNCDVKLQLFLTKLGGYDMGQDQATSPQSMAGFMQGTVTSGNISPQFSSYSRYIPTTMGLYDHRFVDVISLTWSIDMSLSKDVDPKHQIQLP